MWFYFYYSVVPKISATLCSNETLLLLTTLTLSSVLSIYSLNDLIAANYIEPIKDYNGKDCDFDNSYVQIFKYSQKDYSYSAYLKCNGTTEGSSSGDNSGDSSEENKPVYESIPNIPVIEAKIQADKNKQDKTEKPDLAYIKIKGNKSATTKILYYSYVIYNYLY